MRILFLSHYFPPEGNAPASRTYQNCRRFAAAGHAVTVVTCVPNAPAGRVYPGYRNRLRSRECVDGIEVVRVVTFVAANRGTVLRILNYLSYLVSATCFSLFLPRPDVVVATSPQFFCGWAGVLVSRLRRTPFVLEIRDLWPESIEAVGALRGRPLLGLLRRLERRMYAAADRIVTVGEGYRDQLLDKGVPAARLSIVTNGVDRELFSPREADPALRRELGAEGKFVVTYSGTIGMACGLEVVLRAAERLRAAGRADILFLLVGDGASRERLEAEARARGLDSVRFTGRQERSRMPAFLAASDACLVHLRKTELFRTVMPSKLFEALGMARPVILGVGGYAARFLDEAGAGIVIEPESDSELVEAVERLAADRDLAERFGRAGHAFVTERFDRDRLARDYLEILTNVAREAAR